MLRWFEHSQVYHPDRILVATGEELGRPFENIWLRTRDGVKINGWFYPASQNNSFKSWTLLVCHGNAGNISHRLELCSALLETGVNVLIFDYRGYGKSEGHPSEVGTYLDAEAAYDWLIRKGFAGPNIIAYGESLGGGIATELALRQTVGGLIIESSFSCTADLGAELFPWLPVRWLNTIKYETCSKLPRVHVPVLILHSRGDRLIGFHHAEKNFKIANEPKILCELEGLHSEPLVNKDKFMRALSRFLALAEAKSRSSAASSVRS
jgi:alpha-beta hydrolase superfamily lysophospholipase